MTTEVLAAIEEIKETINYNQKVENALCSVLKSLDENVKLILSDNRDLKIEGLLLLAEEVVKAKELLDIPLIKI